MNALGGELRLPSPGNPAHIKVGATPMAKFGKRHYEAIAEAMQYAIKYDATSSAHVAGVYMAISAMVAMFRHDNQLFQSDRFMRACEPGANVRARA